MVRVGAGTRARAMTHFLRSGDLARLKAFERFDLDQESRRKENCERERAGLLSSRALLKSFRECGMIRAKPNRRDL
jgi:hypothetical protein